MSNSNQLTPNLRQLLSQKLSLSDVKDICHDLKIDFDSLSGDGKADKVRELLNELQRKNRIRALISWLQKHRSDIDLINENLTREKTNSQAAFGNRGILAMIRGNGNVIKIVNDRLGLILLFIIVVILICIGAFYMFQGSLISILQVPTPTELPILETATLQPTNTPQPSATSVPIVSTASSIPSTDTPIPPTHTPLPTATPIPTETSVPLSPTPTQTPIIPTSTNTPIPPPPPTSTAIPQPLILNTPSNLFPSSTNQTISWSGGASPYTIQLTYMGDSNNCSQKSISKGGLNGFQLNIAVSEFTANCWGNWNVSITDSSNPQKTDSKVFNYCSIGDCNAPAPEPTDGPPPIPEP